MWTKPFYFVVGPVPPKVNSDNFGGSRLYPYSIMGNGYLLHSIPGHLTPQIVAKMLEAGVRQIDKIPQETIAEYDAHFWTDRLHEYALIPRSGGKHFDIYQIDPPQYVVFLGITVDDYENIIQKMLEAGVRVVSSPEEALR